MAPALSLGIMIASALGGLVAVFVGHREVHKLRQETGDQSVVTAVLSGDFLSKPTRNAKRRAA